MDQCKEEERKVAEKAEAKQQATEERQRAEMKAQQKEGEYRELITAMN